MDDAMLPAWSHFPCLLLVVAIASSYLYYSPPLSCSPDILCTTYNIAIIDDAMEIEKETDIETENETNDRILSGWPHFHYII